VSKKDLNEVFDVNGRSLLLKHYYIKAKELEAGKFINGGEVNLKLLEAAVLAIKRHTRFDIISLNDRSLAETFYAALCPVSLNKKDILKLFISAGVIEEHSIHRQFHIDEHIYAVFIKEKGN
jgi:hypothetical protein